MKTFLSGLVNRTGGWRDCLQPQFAADGPTGIAGMWGEP